MCRATLGRQASYWQGWEHLLIRQQLNDLLYEVLGSFSLSEQAREAGLKQQDLGMHDRPLLCWPDLGKLHEQALSLLDSMGVG